MEILYQGIIIVENKGSKDNTQETILYEQTQRTEFDRFPVGTHLSDGRLVKAVKWLPKPVNRRRLKLDLLDLIEQNLDNTTIPKSLITKREPDSRDFTYFQ